MISYHPDNLILVSLYLFLGKNSASDIMNQSVLFLINWTFALDSSFHSII